MSSLVPWDKKTLVEHYEKLRKASMIQPGETLTTPGYGVFVLRGMMGWIKAISAFEATPAKETEYTGIVSMGQTPKIPSEDFTDVVNVYANMVLSYLGEHL